MSLALELARVLPSERLLASGNSSATGKFALLEHVDHGLADEAGGADARRNRGTRFAGEPASARWSTCKRRQLPAPVMTGVIGAHVGVLRAMAQVVVHQHDGEHGFADRRGAQAHAGIVAAGGDDFDGVARDVDGAGPAPGCWRWA